MDIVGKARKLESRVARALDSAAQRLVRPGAREPLEIVHATLDAVEQQLQPAGRGNHVFPFNRIRVSVVAMSHDVRARLEAVFDGQPTLRERILERLRSVGCQVPDLAVKMVYVTRAQPGWASPDFHIEFSRVTPAAHANPPAGATPNRIELTVLHGAAQQRTYSFNQARIDLGRCVEVRDSRHRLIRTNLVAFTEGAGALNQSISRQHAHIAYNAGSGEYRVYDDGSAQGTGIVRSGRTMAVPSGSRGLRLHSSDEIILGEARVRVKFGPEARQHKESRAPA